MRASRMPATIGIMLAILMAFVAEVMNGIPFVSVGDEHLPALARMGAIVPWLLDQGEYWRLLAAMFLHIGLLHLLLNMWALYQLGYVFEVMFGSARFVVIYFVAGIAASITSAIFLSPVGLSAGASGAVFGILGALIVAIRRSPVWRHEPWTRGFTQQLMGWAALNVFIGFSFPGIDNAAHMGGFVTGLVLGFIPHRVPPPPPNRMVIDAQVQPREPEHRQNQD